MIHKRILPHKKGMSFHVLKLQPLQTKTLLVPGEFTNICAKPE